MSACIEMFERVNVASLDALIMWNNYSVWIFVFCLLQRRIEKPHGLFKYSIVI